MTFINQRMNACVEIGFSGGPQWNTLITSMANGHENRNAEWAMPHYRYTASYTALSPVEQNEVRDTFLSLRGQRDSMRFKDWGDYVLDAEALGPVGDGTSTPRQLQKAYTFGSAILYRDILLPITDTIVVSANGTPITVTVDDATGLITPAAPWPSGQTITVSGEFDVRVRFGADFYPFTMPTNNIAQVTVDFVEAITP